MRKLTELLWIFLRRYDRRFAVPAAQSGSAHRQIGEGFVPEELFCFKYYRTVGSDNVVRFGEHRLQILPANGRPSYVHARVEVHERMDGSLAVYYQGHCLATKPAPAEAPVLRARNMARVMPDKADSAGSVLPVVRAGKISETKVPYHPKPGPNHPWRRPFKIYIDKGGQIL